jgi:hypothetical protein
LHIQVENLPQSAANWNDFKTLKYAILLAQGIEVRFSGEDNRRKNFSSALGVALLAGCRLPVDLVSLNLVRNFMFSRR